MKWFKDEPACVYIHTKAGTDDIFYVGFTSNKDSRRPYDVHGRNKHWHRTYKKYGRDVKIVLQGSIKKMLVFEETLIRLLGISNLTNQTLGGEFNFPSDETKLKMSISATGKIVSDITKQRMRLSRTGKPRSKELHEKLRLANIKPVLQFTLDGVLICEYESMVAAKDATGVSRSQISESCNHNRIYSNRKYIFKFKTNKT